MNLKIASVFCLQVLSWLWQRAERGSSGEAWWFHNATEAEARAWWWWRGWNWPRRAQKGKPPELPTVVLPCLLLNKRAAQALGGILQGHAQENHWAAGSHTRYNKLDFIWTPSSFYCVISEKTHNSEKPL